MDKATLNKMLIDLTLVKMAANLKVAFALGLELDVHAIFGINLRLQLIPVPDRGLTLCFESPCHNAPPREVELFYDFQTSALTLAKSSEGLEYQVVEFCLCILDMQFRKWLKNKYPEVLLNGTL